MAEVSGSTWSVGDKDRRKYDSGPPPGVEEERRDNLAHIIPDSEHLLETVFPADTSEWPLPLEPQDHERVHPYDLRDGSLGVREVASLSIRPGSSYECFATQDPDLINAARRMTAQFYLKRGFITHDMLDTEGRIDAKYDPYLSHSTYYVFRNSETGELVASCRKIHFDPEKGEASFPLLDHKEDLSADRLREIESIGLENIVEISALVKNPHLDKDGQAIFRLYRKLFQDAWGADSNGREETFIMACNPKLYKRLRLAFDGIIQRLGPDLDYPGQEAVPAMLTTKRGALEYIRKSNSRINPRSFFFRKVVKFMFTGIDHQALDPEITATLRENGYSQFLDDMQKEPQQDVSPVVAGAEKKISRKPEIIGAAILLGYTALRTVAVAKGVSPDTNVDWRVFLGIEVATTWPYAKGMGTLVRSVQHPEQFTTREKRTAAAVAGASFLAPYAYVVAEGEGLSPGIWTGIAGFAAVSVYGAAKRLRQARKQAATKQDTLSEPQTSNE